MAEPQVAIFIGAKSDLPIAEETMRVLTGLDIPFTLNVTAVHRVPERLHELVKGSTARIFIAIAGPAAALAGEVAALTMRPVIAVPVGSDTSRGSSLAHVPGVAIATVGTDCGDNAGLLAAGMLAVADDRIQNGLASYREAQRQRLLDDDRDIQATLRR